MEDPQVVLLDQKQLRSGHELRKLRPNRRQRSGSFLDSIGLQVIDQVLIATEKIDLLCIISRAVERKINAARKGCRPFAPAAGDRARRAFGLIRFEVIAYVVWPLEKPTNSVIGGPHPMHGGIQPLANEAGGNAAPIVR